MVDLSKIRELVKSQNITIEELAERAGLSSQGLFKLMRENSTKVDTLERIANILNVPISIFFESEGQESTLVSPQNSSPIGDVVIPARAWAVIEKNAASLTARDRQIDILLASLDAREEQINRLITLLEQKIG